MTREDGEYRVHRSRRARHEQATAGLRIAQERLRLRRQRAGQGHLRAVGGPVAARGAGHEAIASQRGHAFEQRYRPPIDLHRAARSARDLQGVPCQTKAGDVGERMDAVERGQLRPGRVQLGRGREHPLIGRVVELPLLERCRHHANAQRLAQHQHIAGAGIRVALHPGGMHQSQRHQAIDRLDRIDRVSARDRDARLATDRRAAFEDPADGRRAQDRHRHADQGQRHDGLAAHGIDVADRVGRGDATEVMRVVDDRHEEVGRGDQRLFVVEPIDGGVIRRLYPDEQFAGDGEGTRPLEDFREHARRDLAAAAAAVRQRGEAGLGRGIGGGGRIHGRAAYRAPAPPTGGVRSASPC